MRGRPKKRRFIQKEPNIRQFSPRGRHGRPGYVELSIDGYEALRLTDFLNYSQKEASESMKVSQQTYSRVLRAARRAVAEAITLGLIISITDPHNRAKSPKKNPKIKTEKPI